MLKDGEECGDRIESVEVTDDPRKSGIYIPPVGGNPGHTVYGDWDK
jgi:hypothetical protein